MWEGRLRIVAKGDDAVLKLEVHFTWGPSHRNVDPGLTTLPLTLLPLALLHSPLPLSPIFASTRPISLPGCNDR